MTEEYVEAYWNAAIQLGLANKPGLNEPTARELVKMIRRLANGPRVTQKMHMIGVMAAQAERLLGREHRYYTDPDYAVHQAHNRQETM